MTDYYQAMFGRPNPKPGGHKQTRTRNRPVVPLVDYLRNPEAHPDVTRQAELVQQGPVRDPITGARRVQPRAPLSQRQRSALTLELADRLRRDLDQEDIDFAEYGYRNAIPLDDMIPYIQERRTRRQAREQANRRPSLWDEFVDETIAPWVTEAWTVNPPSAQAVQLDAPMREPMPGEPTLDPLTGATVLEDPAHTRERPYPPEHPAAHETFADWVNYMSTGRVPMGIERQAPDVDNQAVSPATFAPGGGDATAPRPDAPEDHAAELMRLMRRVRKDDINAGDIPMLDAGALRRAMDRHQQALLRESGQETEADRFYNAIMDGIGALRRRRDTQD